MLPANKSLIWKKNETKTPHTTTNANSTPKLCSAR